MKRFEPVFLVLALAGAVVALVMMFLSAADRQARLDQEYRSSSAWQRAVGLAGESGSLDRVLAVENRRKPAVYAVSKSLDIDQISKR